MPSEDRRCCRCHDRPCSTRIAGEDTVEAIALSVATRDFREAFRANRVFSYRLCSQYGIFGYFFQVCWIEYAWSSPLYLRRAIPEVEESALCFDRCQAGLILLAMRPLVSLMRNFVINMRYGDGWDAGGDRRNWCSRLPGYRSSACRTVMWIARGRWF